MATQPRLQPAFTPEEYLALERGAEQKSEYVDGVIYAMSGASLAHNVIVANLIMSLGPRLRAQGCQIYPSDLKVRSGSRFFYPDVSAICGNPVFHDEEADVALNPAMIVEVLSPTTKSYDKGAKFLTYQRIASLQEYVLVHQDQALVEQYVRQSEGAWIYKPVEGSSSLEILGCSLSLAEIYAGVPGGVTKRE